MTYIQKWVNLSTFWKGTCYSATKVEDETTSPSIVSSFTRKTRFKIPCFSCISLGTEAYSRQCSCNPTFYHFHFDLLASSMLSGYNDYSISDALLSLKKQLFGCHVICHRRVYIYQQNNYSAHKNNCQKI